MDEGQDQDKRRLQSELDELRQRFDQLAARMDTLEQQRAPVPAASKPPAAVSLGPKSSPAAIPAQRSAAPSPPFSPVDQSRSEAIKQRHHQPAMKPKKAARPSFQKPDWLSGTRGLIFGISLIGVIIFIVGIAFLYKLAVDNGWISPTMRVLGGVGLGVVLLVCGEVVRRKINALASSGISAAGIAAIYAAIFAAAKMYQLIDSPTAFAFLVAITVIGVLLGSLSNRVVLAILSLIAAFLVPVLLSTGEPSYIVMPAYLISLLALGLFLSGWRGGAYSYVRKLAWWGTGILGTLWLQDRCVDAPTSSLVFLSTVWLATVVELVVSARFITTMRDRTKWTNTSRAGFLLAEDGEKTFDPRALLSAEARWINSLFGVTAWAVAMAALTLREIHSDLDYLAPLGFAVASIVIAFFTLTKKREGGGLWVKHGSPRSALGAALGINGTLLGVATIATAMGGWMQVMAWAMVGLAAIETARRIRFRAAGIFGLAMFGLALGRLASFDFLDHVIDDPDGSVLSIGYSVWTWQMLFVGGACVAAAWRSRYKVEASITACLSMWVIGGSLIHPQSASETLGPALVLIAMVAAWSRVVFPIAAVLINAIVLASVGIGIAVLGQISVEHNHLVLDIQVISLVIAGLGWVGFALLPGSGFVLRFSSAAVAIGAWGIALWSLDAQLGTSEALLFESLYAAVLVLIGFKLTRWSVMEISGVLIGVLTLGWAAHQVVIGEPTFDQPPLIGTGFWATMILVSTSIWIVLRLRKLHKAKDAPRVLGSLRTTLVMVLLGLAWALLLASSSIEAERVARKVFAEGAVRGAAVSIWWSLFAVASLVLGFRLVAALRWAGLGLLGMVAIKVLVFDTRVLEPAARVVAAMTVGLVIIGAGILYAMMIKSIEPKPENDTTDDAESD